MISETVTSDTFNPPCHDISPYLIDKHVNWYRWHRSCFTEAIPHSNETLWLGQEWNQKLLTAKVIQSSRSSWSVSIIVVPKGDGGKHLVINYRALNKVTRKFTWPMPKVEDIFLKLNGATYFTTLDLRAGYHHIPLDKSSIPKTSFNSPLGNMNILRYHLVWHKHQHTSKSYWQVYSRIFLLP